MPSIGEVARRQLTRVTHRIHSLPVVILMPHSGCNCRCVMCDIWKANQHRQELSRDDLAPHLETFRQLGVRRVVLSGGEALMHTNLWTLCALLKELPIKITLLSTGLLLKHHAAEVVHGCDDVVVSLDGSPLVHDEIRNVPRAFARLAEGVAALRCVDPAYPVRARCVIQRRNFRDLPRIIDTARSIGLDQISFLAADVSSTAFNRPMPWGDARTSDVALSPAEANELRGVVEQTIQSHAADFTAGFVAESPDKLRRLPRYFAAIHGDGDFPETVCNAPWVSTVVEADGTVRPCFFHRSLGNVREQPLEAVLNSPVAIAFRQTLNVRENPICRKCVCTLYLGPRAPVP
ncbi:MAG TPA: radical SAM protein [Chloroflexota bacterium]|nr:radical SAM protein [Chloroflexota bacterium]